MMAKRIFNVLLLFFTTPGVALGQGAKSCSAYNELVAQRDLASGRPKLFLLGGIAPLKRTIDSSIEIQFGFSYHDLGCVRPVDDRCLREYSRVVFTYLDRKYGKEWRTKVRQEVLFLTNPSTHMVRSKSVL